MTALSIIIGIIFVVLGIIGHELIHVFQLRRMGIYGYQIRWSPDKNGIIPKVYFIYDPDEIKINFVEMEIIPSTFTVIMFILAVYSILIW